MDTIIINDTLAADVASGMDILDALERQAAIADVRAEREGFDELVKLIATWDTVARDDEHSLDTAEYWAARSERVRIVETLLGQGFSWDATAATLGTTRRRLAELIHREPERFLALLDLVEADGPVPAVREIAPQVGMARQTVSHWLKVLGVSTTPRHAGTRRPYTARMQQLIVDGVPTREIAATLEAEGFEHPKGPWTDWRSSAYKLIKQQRSRILNGHRRASTVEAAA